METERYDELRGNLRRAELDGALAEKKICLFGHCDATERLVDLLMERGYRVAAILDNSRAKHGKDYRGISIQPPEWIVSTASKRTVVLIVTRFYEAMNTQLRKLGFAGDVIKLVDYNTYAEYSLSADTIFRKQARLRHGQEILASLRKRHRGHLLVFCPFQALGDVYFCMSYLPAFMRKRGADRCAVCVAGKSCGAVVSLFGDYPVEVFEQKELDAAIQACIYEDSGDTYIAHQDRPYVVNLHKALYLKEIPLEKIYCCGVFGLPQETEPARPILWTDYPDLMRIEKGNAVILSPYAKSVTALPMNVWKQIAAHFREKGCQLYTNVWGDEKPLDGTAPISPALSEMKSVVERAGTFVGIRSGLCDVLRTAQCRKIALYPDYYYCDTKWKAINIYAIDGFENVLVKEL